MNFKLIIFLSNFQFNFNFYVYLQACVECIDSGKMTKDLAICIHGLQNTKEDMYLNTEDFLLAITEQLERKMSN